MTIFIQRRLLQISFLLSVFLLLCAQASFAEAADIRATNAFPTAGETFYTTDTITFLGAVENMESVVVPEAGYADVQIDWNSNGDTDISNNANPDTNPDNSENRLGSLSPGGALGLSEVVSNPPIGTHQYRFTVDTLNDLPNETDEDGNNHSPWVSFEVIPVPVAPTITFSATPNPVTLGGSATLTWTVTDATSCTGSNGSAGWSGAKDAGGDSESVSPLVTTLYTISCTGTGGSVTKSFTIDVVTPAPTITFTNSANPINLGSPVTLTWSTTHADTCTASDGWSGAKATNDSEILSPVTTTIYTLNCTGDGGVTTKSQTITVNGVLPTITTFTATPNPVPSGNPVTLDWAVTDATSCTGASGSVGWPGSKAVPSGTQVLTPTVPVIYRLTCTGPAGVSTREVSVTFSGLPDLIPPTWTVGSITGRGIHTSIGSTTLQSLVYNQANTFHGRAMNNGVAATPMAFMNKFIYNWGLTNSQNLGASVASGGALAPGATSATLESSTFTPDRSGFVEMQYCVDNPATIAESIESNNCTYRTYTVAGLMGTPSTTMIIKNGIGTTTTNGSIYYVVGRSVLGSTTTISWKTDDATSCSGASSPTDLAWNNVFKDPVSGSFGVSPTASTTYSLTCTGPTGTTVKTVRLYVTVTVPEVTFSGSSNSVVRGASANLSWGVTSAQSCTGTSNPSDSAWNGHKNRVSGSLDVSPLVNTTYTLTCTSPIGTGFSGGTASKSFTVNVTEPPPSVTLTANFNPITTVITDKTMLTWTAGGATSCTGTSNPNDPTWNGAKSTTGGTLEVSPEETTTYTLSCNGQGVESVTTQLTISVVSTAPIISFGLDDSIIIENKESAIFTWNVLGADSCTGVSNPEDLSWNNFDFNADFTSSKTVNPLVTTTYSLNCSGPWGDTPSQSKTISVIPEATVTEFRVCIAGGGECRTQGQILEVNPGTSLEVFWDSEDATSCSAISGYQFGTAGAPKNGEDLVVMATPKSDSTDTYTIACGSLGYITSDSVSITVRTNSVLPAIWITPKVVESSGGNITVNWNTNNGDQSVCTMKGGGLTWEGGPLNWNLAGRVGQTGSNQVQVLGRTSFVIICPSHDGTDTESATTTVELSPRIWGR